MRVLHAPVNFSDQAGYVVRALRRHGQAAELWEYGASRWGFEADRTIDASAQDPVVLWETFLESIRRFDVFHFYFARSLFPFSWSGVPPYWDLPVLKALGKRVFFTFLGSDCRMRRIHARYNPWSDRFFSEFEPDDDRIAKAINVIRTYADRMFALSRELQLYVPEAEYMPRAFALDEWPELRPEQRNRPVVVHVPSRRSFKGTDLIVEGMRRLEEEGVRFEFRLIEGIPHQEMKKVIADADVVIDNILMGDHGITSLEAMACNRVAVAYVMDDVRPVRNPPPIFDVTPDEFVERMRQLLRDPALRHRIAEEGRRYVATYHDVDALVPRYLRGYEEAARRPPARSFPDWTGYGDVRRIERLEERTAELEQDRVRIAAAERSAREEALELRRRLAAVKRAVGNLRGVRKLVPGALERSLLAALEGRSEPEARQGDAG